MSESLYTRNGDQGITQLPDNRHVSVSKNDPAIEFYGVIEELNAYVGLLKAFKFSLSEQ
ncbi:ATP:cob(I)alamin adenosyltransferase [Thalassotalea litorea]|uniref:ATP:cob(I)alamin adenosyltransferase n=1 Tax=Thalassotalea litorea TaxID=2020715 RepID=UPI003736FB13